MSVVCEVHAIKFRLLEKEKIMKTEYYMVLLVRVKQRIALSRRQCTMSQIHRNDVKTT